MDGCFIGFSYPRALSHRRGKFGACKSYATRGAMFPKPREKDWERSLTSGELM